MVSLAGAASFKIVTKLYKGKFKFCRNEFLSAMIKTCLTVRQTSQTETKYNFVKVGHSDPVILNGKIIAYGRKVRQG